MLGIILAYHRLVNQPGSIRHSDISIRITGDTSQGSAFTQSYTLSQLVSDTDNNRMIVFPTSLKRNFTLLNMKGTI